jgi:peptidoglycan/xylan/chitin deacetylase (PgdA/CDA1 family)
MNLSDVLVWIGSSRPFFMLKSPTNGGGAIYQGPDTYPMVALTFDDGPDPRWTPPILAALSAAQAKATFFCSGEAVDRNPDLVLMIASAGHEIGTHLWGHCSNTVNDLQVFFRDLDRSLERIVEITGQPVHFLRFPYGHAGKVSRFDLADRGLRAVHWTVRGRDTTEPDPTRIVSRIMSAARPGAIVLLHDAIADEQTLKPGYLVTREQTVRALPPLLEGLTNRGLRPVTLGELLA